MPFRTAWLMTLIWRIENMSKQAKNNDNVGEWFQEAKEIAKAEKSMGVERWVKIYIERVVDDNYQNVQVIHKYDIPVRLAERYDWVIRWRKAKMQCLYPRDLVRQSSCYYKKVMGVTIKMQEDLDRLISEKAQLTKQRNIINAYVDEKRKANDMFYDERDDKVLQAAKEKLKLKEQNVKEAEERLQRKLQEAKLSALNK